MTKSGSRGVPTLRKRKSPSSGRVLAYAKFSGRTVSFGGWGASARRDFDAFLSRWIANGRQIPDDEFEARVGGLTVDRLAERFLLHLKERHPDPWIRNNFNAHRLALAHLTGLYGPSDAAAFSPSRLQAVRRAMLDGRRRR